MEIGNWTANAIIEQINRTRIDFFVFSFCPKIMMTIDREPQNNRKWA